MPEEEARQMVSMTLSLATEPRAGAEALELALPAARPAWETPVSRGPAVLPTLAVAERLRAMVDAHFDFTARCLRNLGVPPGEVDDAAQQVFIVAWRKLDRIAIQAERSFLFATALRIASRARRTVTRRREADGDGLPEQAYAGPGPDEMLEAGRARRLVDEVLGRLALALRTVFVLYEIEQLSTGEIAALLSIPQGTVKSRLRRARQVWEQEVRRVRSAAGAEAEGA